MSSSSTTSVLGKPSQCQICRERFTPMGWDSCSFCQDCENLRLKIVYGSLGKQVEIMDEKVFYSNYSLEVTYAVREKHYRDAKAHEIIVFPLLRRFKHANLAKDNTINSDCAALNYYRRDETDSHYYWIIAARVIPRIRLDD